MPALRRKYAVASADWPPPIIATSVEICAEAPESGIVRGEDSRYFHNTGGVVRCAPLIVGTACVQPPREGGAPAYWLQRYPRDADSPNGRFGCASVTSAIHFFSGTLEELTRLPAHTSGDSSSGCFSSQPTSHIDDFRASFCFVPSCNHACFHRQRTIRNVIGGPLQSDGFIENCHQQTALSSWFRRKTILGWAKRSATVLPLCRRTR